VNRNVMSCLSAVSQPTSTTGPSSSAAGDTSRYAALPSFVTFVAAAGINSAV
jgi:hypothetical protein